MNTDVEKKALDIIPRQSNVSNNNKTLKLRLKQLKTAKSLSGKYLLR